MGLYNRQLFLQCDNVLSGMCSITERMPFIYYRDSRGTSSTPTATGGSLECCEEDNDTATVVRNDVIQYAVGTLYEIFRSSIYLQKKNQCKQI